MTISESIRKIAADIIRLDDRRKPAKSERDVFLESDEGKKYLEERAAVANDLKTVSKISPKVVGDVTTSDFLTLAARDPDGDMLFEVEQKLRKLRYGNPFSDPKSPNNKFLARRAILTINRDVLPVLKRKLTSVYHHDATMTNKWKSIWANDEVRTKDLDEATSKLALWIRFYQNLVTKLKDVRDT